MNTPVPYFVAPPRRRTRFGRCPVTRNDRPPTRGAGRNARSNPPWAKWVWSRRPDPLGERRWRGALIRRGRGKLTDAPRPRRSGAAVAGAAVSGGCFGGGSASHHVSDPTAAEPPVGTVLVDGGTLQRPAVHDDVETGEITGAARTTTVGPTSHRSKDPLSCLSRPC
jgi:hypothetical protein